EQVADGHAMTIVVADEVLHARVDIAEPAAAAVQRHAVAAVEADIVGVDQLSAGLDPDAVAAVVADDVARLAPAAAVAAESADPVIDAEHVDAVAGIAGIARAVADLVAADHVQLTEEYIDAVLAAVADTVADADDVGAGVVVDLLADDAA